MTPRPGALSTAQNSSPGFLRHHLPRGLALFFGLFCLTNLVGNLLSPGFDANLWWIDLRWLPEALGNVLLGSMALGLIVFGARMPRSTWCRRPISIGALALAFITFVNAVNFLILLARGSIAFSAFPLPLSLLVAISMLLISRAAWKWSAPPFQVQRGWLRFAVFASCVLVLPLAQMVCFGKTDYRRKADVAVVPGCRAYADGRPSDALADRVRTACQLYRDGFTHKLLFSGGPGDGAFTEATVMRTMALKAGVRNEDIIVDNQGLNTQATVSNSRLIFADLKASRIMVVSHFYHLPRIKMAYQRAGWEVYTVPARETYLLRQMPYNMAREVAALWVYYLRPLT